MLQPSSMQSKCKTTFLSGIIDTYRSRAAYLSNGCIYPVFFRDIVNPHPNAAKVHPPCWNQVQNLTSKCPEEWQKHWPPARNFPGPAIRVSIPWTSQLITIPPERARLARLACWCPCCCTVRFRSSDGPVDRLFGADDTRADRSREHKMRSMLMMLLALYSAQPDVDQDKLNFKQGFQRQGGWV